MLSNIISDPEKTYTIFHFKTRYFNYLHNKYKLSGFQTWFRNIFLLTSINIFFAIWKCNLNYEFCKKIWTEINFSISLRIETFFIKKNTYITSPSFPLIWMVSRNFFYEVNKLFFLKLFMLQKKKNFLNSTLHTTKYISTNQIINQMDLMTMFTNITQITFQCTKFKNFII